MKYPTLEEVEAASYEQLARWPNYLPAPGINAVKAGVINNEEYEQTVADENAIIGRIGERAMQFDADFPLEEQALQLCYAIEKIAASDEATNASVLASALHARIKDLNVQPAESGLIKRIWYDEGKGQVFIHANCRSGLLHLPVQGGSKTSFWLADLLETGTNELPVTETIYRLMDIENGSFKAHASLPTT